MSANWELLLSQVRRKDETKAASGGTSAETRTETERDHDRILFSTPVRRLADKTQVFPLERNDSVRTRLTHSHEVSNLARSIGTNLAFNHGIGNPVKNFQRNVPAMLAATGLAHDLGNPPFGHQGEAAIRKWFETRPDLLESLGKEQQNDFLKFEGNAQTLRLLTRLQLLNDNFGLDLTVGTLAALMKYTVSSSETDPDALQAGKRKNGFFQSEKEIAEEVWRKVGLPTGTRHPFSYIMEACDDIAYSVLDTEDAVKKGLASFNDVVAFLRHMGGNDAVIESVCKASEAKHDEYRKKADLSPAELNDISMQRFRVYAIGAMVTSVSEAFLLHLSKLLDGTFEKDLIASSSCSKLCKSLKTFDLRHAYRNRAVLEVELNGYNVIQQIMSYMWTAVSSRDDPSSLSSRRSLPFANYVYNRISENYRRIAEDKDNRMPLRYREFQLITDMVSGMTDSFAVSFAAELKKYEQD